MQRSDNLYALPADLPVPTDDGACRHLAGMTWPKVALPSTSGRLVSLADDDSEWLVVYFYPRTGLPDQDPPGGLHAWDSIPGARGCTPQACAYRDHRSELARHGALVFGVSTQDSGYQREVVERLHLPYELLSDSSLELTNALRLPTFTVAGQTLIKRLTLISRNGRIETCFYPVFPPDADAANVLRYISGSRTTRYYEGS
jgi:peroxiredoxin